MYLLKSGDDDESMLVVLVAHQNTVGASKST